MISSGTRFFVQKGRYMTSTIIAQTPISISALPFLRKMSSKTIPPIERILKPLSVKEKRLLGPGPSNMADSISKALAQPLLGHLHPEFLEIMDDVKAGLQYVFQTKNPLTFAISGTGHAGMECAILNLLEPDETILVLQNGIWGQRAADLSKRMNLNVKTITVPEGGIIELEDFKKAVETFNLR